MDKKGECSNFSFPQVDAAFQQNHWKISPLSLVHWGIYFYFAVTA